MLKDLALYMNVKKLILLPLLIGILLASACPRETSLSGGKIIADLSRKDLSQRINLPAEEISVVSVKETPASSTPTGYVVVLEAGGGRYEYYSDGGESVAPREAPAAIHSGSTKKPAANTVVEGNAKEGFYIPVETTGLMDGKPWVPVN